MLIAEKIKKQRMGDDGRDALARIDRAASGGAGGEPRHPRARRRGNSRGLIQRLRVWWQNRTGDEETPFDGDVPAWAISTLVHLLLLLVVALIPVLFSKEELTLTVSLPLALEEEFPEEFQFDTEPPAEIGANSVSGIDAGPFEALDISMPLETPAPELSETALGDIQPPDTTIDLLEQEGIKENRSIKGMGVTATGASGAIDRITQEILLSLEQRKTLVVWLFDQSRSLDHQRKAIYDRLDRIYEELRVIESSNNPAFQKHDDKPLLTAVVAFGRKISLRTRTPTDNLAVIKRAVALIEGDGDGTELTFSAIFMAANKFKSYREPDPIDREPKRNVMIVVFSDEAGDDQEYLDKAINVCRRYEMPAYVVGVPAPFGRKEALVKWVDPDPKFKQRPDWGVVTQGPESALRERLQLRFSGSGGEPAAIDSGFGPYGLTRMCYETGGIYFAVHPNRESRGAVSRGQTARFSAHLQHFFDPEVMRPYRPDYVTRKEYLSRLAANKARAALVGAAERSVVTPLERPRLRFPKRSEAALVKALSKAQHAAAKAAPQVDLLHEMLRRGAADRDKETVPRWQAGYDLAMGRAAAAKVRVDGYNAMLARAKLGMAFADPRNDTWLLVPSDNIGADSRLEKLVERARFYLNRVGSEHAGTPWSLLAQRELKEPLGWRWQEIRTGVNQPRPTRIAGVRPRPPRDDRRRVLKRPKPKRPVPKL